MPEDVFRIVVAIAVALGCLAFVVQAVVMLALYRSSRAMQDKASPLIDQLQPFLKELEPMVLRVGTVLEKASPVIEKVGPVADQVQLVLASANRIMEETRPRISEISANAAAIVESGRHQVDRIGELVSDASNRAMDRLEQIDESVNSTVAQVEQVGDSMKRAVLRPVREVNGFAAGLSAAVSAIVHGRKSSVDSATQDEEMFI